MTGPYVLTTSGTYTLTLNNVSGGSAPLQLQHARMPQAATSLALGPTQTVSGTLNPGYTTGVYSFLGVTRANASSSTTTRVTATRSITH